MKFFSLTSLVLGLFSVANTNAAKSFSASNLYYAAGLTDGQQTILLNGIQSAGVKVLRVWLDGKDSPPASRLNTRPVADQSRRSIRSDEGNAYQRLQKSARHEPR
jgi:hypothetical protein